jgi:hypothetical protein
MWRVVRGLKPPPPKEKERWRSMLRRYKELDYRMR